MGPDTSKGPKLESIVETSKLLAKKGKIMMGETVYMRHVGLEIMHKVLIRKRLGSQKPDTQSFLYHVNDFVFFFFNQQ